MMLGTTARTRRVGGWRALIPTEPPRLDTEPAMSVPPAPAAIHESMSPPVLDVADDLFFAAHDDMYGTTHLPHWPLNLTIAAGLLGELLVAERATTDLAGRLVLMDGRKLNTWVTAAVFNRLAAGYDRAPLPDVLRLIASQAADVAGTRWSAADAVADRMVRAKLIQERHRSTWIRVLFGAGSVAWRPTNMNWPAWTSSRIIRVIHSRDETGPRTAEARTLSVSDLLYAGLVDAAGLDRYVFRSLTRPDVDYLRAQIVALPAAHQSLINCARQLLDEAVLTPH